MRIQKAMTRVDVEQARRVAARAAEDAGALLRDGAGGDLGLRAKNATGDVVTDLDLAAEALIVERLRGAFPGHRILAEESGLHDAEDGSWTWLVDPLDGTNNIAIGLSAYVVGIALCERQRPVLGVVHDPVSGHTYSAIRGHGAHGPGDIAMRAPYRPAPHGPVLAWTQGHGVRREDATARALRLVVESGSRRMLQLWTPLLSWTMLARGDIDGFIGYQPEGIDLPAGYLIAREAGISVCALDGSPFDDDIRAENRSFVAGHTETIPLLLDLLAGAEHVRVRGLGSGEEPDEEFAEHVDEVEEEVTAPAATRPRSRPARRSPAPVR